MTDSEWDELETIDQKACKKRFDYLMALTVKVGEHPEWFAGPCMCELCRSYSD